MTILAIYHVQVEERRIRRHRIAAPSAEAAERMVRQTLGRHDRIVTSAEVALTLDDEAAEQALAMIVNQPFVPLAGAPMTVRDWLRRAIGPTERAAANAVLASAGLRVYGGDPIGEGRYTAHHLYIGSAATIPTLTLWCAGTRFAGSGLTAALRHLSGATLTNMTYAGRRARSVCIPMQPYFSFVPKMIEATE